MASGYQAQITMLRSANATMDGIRDLFNCSHEFGPQDVQDWFLCHGGRVRIWSGHSPLVRNSAVVEQISDDACGHRLHVRVFDLLVRSALHTYTAIPGGPPIALERELPKIRSRAIPKGPSRRAGSLEPHRHYGPRHDFHRDCAITGPRYGRVPCRRWTARGAEPGDSLRCDCRMDSVKPLERRIASRGPRFPL